MPIPRPRHPAVPAASPRPTPVRPPRRSARRAEPPPPPPPRVHSQVGRPYKSPLRCTFPYANRGASVRKLHLRGFLQKQRDAGVPFVEVAADWQFLLHCAAFLPPDELEALCGAVASGGGSKKAKAALERAERLIAEHCNLK